MRDLEDLGDEFDGWIDSVTEVLAQGGDQRGVQRLLLKASAQVLLLQTLFGALSPKEADELRSIYSQLGDTENGKEQGEA